MATKHNGVRAKRVMNCIDQLVCTINLADPVCTTVSRVYTHIDGVLTGTAINKFGNKVKVTQKKIDHRIYWVYKPLVNERVGL